MACGRPDDLIFLDHALHIMPWVVGVQPLCGLKLCRKKIASPHFIAYFIDTGPLASPKDRRTATMIRPNGGPSPHLHVNTTVTRLANLIVSDHQAARLRYNLAH
jgi:hypothetical protein